MRIDSDIKIKVDEAKVASTTDGMLDMVIAFDTTGSMFCYIDSVKKYVTELVPTLFSQNPNLQLSIVAFGDYCDMIDSTKFGYAYQYLPLSKDTSEIIDFIKNAKNTSGGDAPEFYELVIKKITEETNWREGSTRSVLLIGDASPHGESYYVYSKLTYIDWRKECRKSKDKNIQIDTLSISNQDFYKEVSRITEGIYLPFSNSAKTNQVIQASALARGGEVTKDAFYKTMTASAGDREITAVYNMYKNIVD